MCNGVVVYTSLIHLQKLKRRYIFMDKVKTKIIGTDYFKFLRVFIPLSVIFMTAGAAMGGTGCACPFCGSLYLHRGIRRCLPFDYGNILAGGSCMAV